MLSDNNSKFNTSSRNITIQSPKDIRIGIIGAGPAGLGLALSLKNAGFNNLLVFEKDKSHSSREQGYSFTLFENGGLSLVKALNLPAMDDKIAFKSKGLRIVDGNGNLIVKFAPKKNDETRRILRKSFREYLLEACKKSGIDVLYGRKLLEYVENDKEEEIVVKFEEDKREIYVDLLIGADGYRSGIRDQLVGDKLIYTGFSCLLGYLKREDNEDLFKKKWLQNAGLMVLLKGLSLFIYHHPPDQLFWGLNINCSEGELKRKVGKYMEDKDEEGMKKVLNELLADCHGYMKDVILTSKIENIEMILELKDRDPPIINKNTQRVYTSETGRITLIGDAAHPMLPFKAAGGNNALLDCIVLVEKLKSVKFEGNINEYLRESLKQYEQEMAKRTAKDVTGSRTSGAQFHEKSDVKIFFRNIFLGVLGWFLNQYPKKISILLNFNAELSPSYLLCIFQSNLYCI